MKHIPHIKSCMTPFPYSIEGTATLDDAAEQMRAHDIRHLPVLQDGELAGMVSARDIQHCRDNPGRLDQQALPSVAIAMVPGVYAVDLNESLDNVLLHMAQQHVDCALVTKKGKLVGLFTVTDACRTFSAYLRDQFLPEDGNDAA